MTARDRQGVLWSRMTNFLKLFIVSILVMFASAAVAEPSDCKDCDRQKEESAHREQIKAERAKYDRENEKVTARPWDGTRYDRSPRDKE